MGFLKFFTDKYASGSASVGKDDPLPNSEQNAIGWENPFSTTDGQIVTSQTETISHRFAREGILHGQMMALNTPVTMGGTAALNNIMLANVTNTKIAQIVSAWLTIPVAGQVGDFVILRDKNNNVIYNDHLMQAGRLIIPQECLTPYNAGGSAATGIVITGTGFQDIKLQITTTAGSPLLSAKVYAGLSWTER